MDHHSLLRSLADPSAHKCPSRPQALLSPCSAAERAVSMRFLAAFAQKKQNSAAIITTQDLKSWNGGEEGKVSSEARAPGCQDA